MADALRTPTHMRRAASVIALAFGLLGAACLVPGDDGVDSSEAAHTARAFTAENSPYSWTEQSYEDFRVSQANLGSTFDAPALADGTELQVRLQTWLDRIDAIVRPDVEKETGTPLHAPRPIAKVIHSNNTFNAWVSGTLACTGTPIGSSSAAPPPGSSAFLDFDYVVPATGAVCARPASWTASGFATFWNAARPTCSIRASETGFTIEKPACQVTEGAAPAADTMVIATSPYIQFSTDLVMHLDENAIALVAAHELGHYYMAHGTSVGRSKYNFWYALGDRQQTRPARAPNAAELEAAYKEVVSPAVSGFVPFGKKFSARLRPLLLAGVAPLLQERTEADFVCAAARDALGPWVTDALGTAPSPDARTAYEAFEKKLAACAPQLALGEAGSRALSAGQVLFAAGRARPGPKAKVSLSLGDTLASFLDRLDVKAKELDTKAARLVQRAKQNGFGLYTTEQAADDFAVELASKLGLTGEEILGGWVAFMEAADAVTSYGLTPEVFEDAMKQAGELTAKSCKTLLAADFTTTDASGHRIPMTMSLGRLEEPHHASCYRLFNMWREIRAHRYTPGPRQPELQPPWSVLREQAAQLTAMAAAPPAAAQP